MSASMTKEEFARRADVSRETVARLAAYADLLVRWQARINLIGAASAHDIWGRHMWDSAQLAPLIPKTANIIVDLGSGAGFPGLVLAIITGRTIALVEANQRKAAFLREAARITHAPVEIHESRVESLPDMQADLVTARAVAPLPDLLGLAAHILAADGEALFLKGARVMDELTAAEKIWNMKIDWINSQSDPSGVILRIWDIARV